MKVSISEAVDSLGNPVAKMGADGKRTKPTALRPTYLQNLRYLFGYQIGYMYLRYLMWNFSGRQNDIPSTGEVEHGNFITGFPAIDNAMLEAEDALPRHAGEDNPGRNRYYMLPLLLGIWGIVWMLRSNWRGRMACGVVAALFIMTGVALVVYLNQTPAEPRERDYTFLGSYMAFAIWIGAGALGLSRVIAELLEKIWIRRHGFRLRRMLAAAAIGFLPSAGVIGLMLAQNTDDHDRSGRRVARTFAVNLLNSLDRDAVIFVDGDNYTFPLWYAQEVEGVRRDVRVVNLSYLANPKYAALVLGEWEEAKRLESVLKAADIIYHAHIFDSAEKDCRDTLPALDLLYALKKNPEGKVKAGTVSVALASGDTLYLPVTALSRSCDGLTFEFRKLMMLDLIASNGAAESRVKRPFYWQKNVAGSLFMRLEPLMTDRMYAYRLGHEPEETTDSAVIAAARASEAPNDLQADHVYMDRTPASMLGRMRADVTAATKRLLRRGRKSEALEIMLRTHREYGSNPYTLQPVRMGDSVFHTEKEFADMFIELADSLDLSDFRPDGITVTTDSLRTIGERLHREGARRNGEWVRYKKTLSPDMRLNMSKTP